MVSKQIGINKLGNPIFKYKDDNGVPLFFQSSDINERKYFKELLAQCLMIIFNKKNIIDINHKNINNLNKSFSNR
jgi:hypothetical protein